MASAANFPSDVSITDALPIPAWTIRNDMLLTHVNPVWLAHTGLIQNDSDPDWWLQAVHPEDRTTVLSAWESAVERNQLQQVEFRFLHGETRSYRWHIVRHEPVRDAAGNRLGWIGIAIDIDDRKRLEVDRDLSLRQAQAAMAQMGAMLDGLPEAMLVMDDHYQVVSINRAMSRLTGFTLEEFREIAAKGENVVMEDPGEVAREWANLRANGSWHGDLEARCKDGRRVPIEAIVTVASVPTGENVYIGTWREVSQRRAKEQVHRDLLGMVAHDLKAPLAALKATGQLMVRRGAYTAEGVDAMLTQAARMQRLLADLTSLAEVESGGLTMWPSMVDIRRVCLETIAAARALSPDAYVAFEAPEGPLIAHADRDRVTQVLQNLVDNAGKYSTDRSPVIVHVRPSEHEMVITVEDHGAGISPEQASHLFERFYRSDAARSTDGFGLGLYISRTLIEAQGGRIWVESQPGEGSRFSFSLRTAEQSD